MSDLLYCRQFILGPRFVDFLPTWKRLEIGPNLKLSFHPELDCELVAQSDKQLVAIGPMLDSKAPEKSDREILSDLVEKADDIDTLTRETSPYGGRWILIARFGTKHYLLNDPSGLRQAFYTDPATTGECWVVSQPGLADRLLKLQLDEEAIAYMDSYAFRIRDEFGWPSSATVFHGLTHLLPNHLLDLDSGKDRRFWPWAPIDPLPTEDAEEIIALRLTNLLMAVANRYPLSIGMTAGIDSRVIMALARNISKDVDFITVRQRKMRDDHPDISIPAELCKKHALRHRIVKSAITMSADFAKLFKDNVFMAVDIYGPDAEAILNKLGRKTAVITGSAGEIGQCSFQKFVPPEQYNGPITAGELAKAVSNEEPYVIKHFQNWLNGAKNRHNIKLMDLFDWEQSHGNWLPMTQIQFDIAWREIITPYNCRDILETLLAVDAEHRAKPALSLQKSIISRAWPELLEQPINPHQTPSQTPIARAKRLVRKGSKKFLGFSRRNAGNSRDPET